MTPLRSHGKLVLKNENLLLLTSSSSRRIVFFLLFVVFGVAMIVGFDPARDLAGSRFLGTLGYAAVLAVLLGVSAWSKTIRFDRAAGRMESEAAVFGFTIKREETCALASIDEVLVQKVQLLKGRDGPFRRSGTLSGLFEPRAQLFRLFLEIDDHDGGRFKLDESNYREEIEHEASVLAEFLGVKSTTQEI
jgi:hypothetical protein